MLIIVLESHFFEEIIVLHDLIGLVVQVQLESARKMGAQFTFLPLTRSIIDGFSKFFYLLKAGLNCQFVKKMGVQLRTLCIQLRQP